MIEFSAPIKTVSEANRREHWVDKRKRRIAQQQEVDAELLRALGRNRKVPLPCVVTLTRIAPRKLDDDNLRSAFKGIRDAIAARLGVDDGSDQIRFEYQQIPVRSRTYWIKVGITH